MRVCFSHFSAVLAMVLVLLACDSVHSGWLAKKREEKTSSWDDRGIVPRKAGVSFELESFDQLDTGGQKLLEELKTKINSPCWHQAYTTLLSGCKDMFKDPDKKLRLAYKFTDCFLQDVGRPQLKKCPDTVPIKDCTKRLDEHHGQILAKFFIEIMSMCHRIQSELFKFETEDMVSSLIETTKSYKTRLEAMQNHAKVMQENMERMAGSYQQLVQNATQMKDNLLSKTEQQHALLKDMSDQLLSSNQQQSKNLEVYHEAADRMDEKVSKYLAGQEQQLASQSVELARLHHIKEGLEVAMQQNLLGFAGLRKDAREKRKEFEAFQTKMEDTNQRLLDGSLNLLKAQENVHSKTSVIIGMVDSLQSLNVVILSYLGIMKALIFYVPATILVHLVTGSEHAVGARAPIYIGLIATFSVEFGIIGTEQFSLFGHSPLPTALYVRGAFSALAVAYTFYCILTYRDVDVAKVNYDRMLLGMQKQLEANEVVVENLCERYGLRGKARPARRLSRVESFSDQNF